MEVYNHFQEVDNINDVQANETVVNIVNTIIQDSMAFVMQVTAILLGIVFLMTLRIEGEKTEKTLQYYINLNISFVYIADAL